MARVLCFDYARPACGWRDDGHRSIYVMTHDPIGLGEDGPTSPAG
jgi:transketolase